MTRPDGRRTTQGTELRSTVWVMGHMYRSSREMTATVLLASHGVKWTSVRSFSESGLLVIGQRVLSSGLTGSDAYQRLIDLVWLVGHKRSTKLHKYTPWLRACCLAARSLAGWPVCQVQKREEKREKKKRRFTTDEACS
jgi:hypothetical protein